MKKSFEKPAMKISKFIAEKIITTSSEPQKTANDKAVEYLRTQGIDNVAALKVTL